MIKTDHWYVTVDAFATDFIFIVFLCLVNCKKNLTCISFFCITFNTVARNGI